MLRILERFSAFRRAYLAPVCLAGVFAVHALLPALGASQTRFTRTQQDKEKEKDRIEEAQRREGEAVLGLADAAMAGKPTPSDFAISWRNDFLKAQQGTFVPFTLMVDASKLRTPEALLYVRAAPRGSGSPADGDAKEKARKRRGREVEAEETYPVDAIFQIELKPESGQIARISRGFSVSPGDYDVYVVIRERSGEAQATPKAAVLKQALAVPNYWSNELTTSTVILADRLTMLTEPLAPDELIERPYVIGLNDVQPALDATFRRHEELIFVFLVYNPTVATDKEFDVQVEYHFFKKAGAAESAGPVQAAGDHPPERDGERYLNRTDPQRFNRATMGSQFDPAAGHPVMAGQGVPLAGFQDGEYRLAIRVSDLLGGRSITRDVSFTVGS